MSRGPEGAVSDTPLVSVIIPTFNNGRYILAALESVWAQQFPDVETIVVDDGSTDDTAHVLGPHTSRLRYVRQDNAGSAVARNHGLRLARGSYVVFLDADDFLLPGKLAAQVPWLDAHPELGAIHSGWRVVDDDGRTITEIEPWHTAPRLDLEAWVVWKPVKLGAMVFRRQWLERVGGFDRHFRQSQDVDLMLQLALAGCRMEWLRRPTLCYRRHAESTISRGAAQQGTYINLVLDKFYAHPNVPPALRRREREIRYYSRLWAAWHAQRYGLAHEAASRLREAAQLSERDARTTALEWVVHFERWAARDAVATLDLAALATLISSVLADPGVAPTLARWVDMWRHYERGAPTEGRAGLARHDATPLSEMLADVERCLAVAAAPSPRLVEQWWRDVCSLRTDAASAPHLLTGVLLGFCLPSGRPGVWHRVRAALPPALRAGATWRATPIWLAFLRRLAGQAWARVTGP